MTKSVYLTVAASEGSQALALSTSLASAAAPVLAPQFTGGLQRAVSYEAMDSIPSLVLRAETGEVCAASASLRNSSRIARAKTGMDVLEQLKSNLTQLDELCSRLHFMMAEVRYLTIRD